MRLGRSERVFLSFLLFLSPSRYTHPLLIAFVRRKLVYRRLARFKARKNVITELSLTEQKYLVSLRLSTSEYLHPMVGKCSTADEILPAEQVKAIFGSIEIVELLSKRLLVEFTRRAVRCNYYTRIGEIFLSLESSLQCYADYVKGYDAARKMLAQAMEQLPALKEFDLAVQKKHNTRLGIRDFLIMPVQRVPRYILLLRDILKQTDKSLPDYADVKAAMGKLEEFTVHMDFEAQRSEALRIIQSKLSGNLTMLQASSAGDRRFLHEGPLLDVDKGKRMYLFLFSDIVVVAQNKEDMPAPSKMLTLRRMPKDDGRMHVVETVQLTELSRCTNIKGDGAAVWFKLDGTLYQCQSDEERQIWLGHIHRILRVMRSKATKRMVLQMSSSTSLQKEKASQERARARWSTEYEGLVVNSANSAESLRRASSSGFVMGPSRMKRSSSSIGSSMSLSASSSAASSVQVTSNPLLVLQQSHSRSRSRSAAGPSSVPSSTSLPPPPPPMAATVAPSIVGILKFDFQGSSEKELSAVTGQEVTVIRQLQSGWTLVSNEGATGVIPTSYLDIFEKVIDSPPPPPAANLLPPPSMITK